MAERPRRGSFGTFLRAYWRLMVAAFLLIPALLPYFTGLPIVFAYLSCILSVLFSGYPLLAELKFQIKARRFDAVWLLVLGVVIGLCLSDVMLEASVTMLLYMIARSWQKHAVQAAAIRVDKPPEFFPEKAVRLVNEQAESISLSEIQVGDLLLVGANQYVPADGLITERQAELDMTALTGQTKPVLAGVDDFVPSGALARNASFIMKATATADDSTAARLLALSEHGEDKKAHMQLVTEIFAKYTTPAIALCAVLMAVLPLIFAVPSWFEWFYRALVLLTAASSYALSLSGSLGFYMGHRLAAQKGAMIKGGEYLERLAKVDTIAMDKTGTLTSGHVEVTDIITVEGISRDMALSMAAILERYSTNPAAQAVVDAAAKRQVQGGEWQVLRVKNHPALGVSAEINGNAVLCGGERMMKDAGINLSQLPPATVYLAVGRMAVAAFQTTTQLQSSAAEAVSALRKLDVRRLVMLTGDHVEEAARVGKEIGINEIYSEMLPQDKVSQIRAMRSGGHLVAYIGDGEKDPDAIQAADIGIALGLDSPASVELAHVVLTGNELTPLPFAIRAARRTVHAVNLGFGLSIFIKVAVLTLAICGILPMWIAVIADAAAALLVIGKDTQLADACPLPEVIPPQAMEDADEFTP